MRRPLLPLLACLALGAALPASLRRADPMSEAAAAFLAALEPAQREAAAFGFDEAERTNWQPVPFGEAGVRLRDLDEAQRARAFDLVRAALSKDGVATVEGVILLEGILVGLEAEQGRPSQFHGADRYFFTVFGEPGGDAPWAWRIEGHHLSMTFTLLDGAWVCHGPLFVGAQPAHVRGGEHDGFRLLGAHDDGVRALLRGLPPELASEALLERPVPGNVLLVPGEDAGFERAEGLRAKDLDEAGRAALVACIAEWAGWLRGDLAEAELERVRAGLGETSLLWLGDLDPAAGHYWRITGPHFVLEYCAPDRDPDHVHALWRDQRCDFGGDPLARHLAAEHGGDAGAAEGDGDGGDQR